jgi:hypothetical protein
MTIPNTLDVEDLLQAPRPTVYVPYQPMMRSPTGNLVPKIDLHKVEEFGNTISLLDWPEVRDMDMQVIYSKLAPGLAEFRDSDMILMVGNPVITALMAMIAADVNEGVVNLLYWDRALAEMQGRYVVVKADLNESEKFLPFRS